MTGIQYAIGVNSSQGVSGIAAIRNAFSGLTGMVGKIGPLLGFAGGLGVAAAAIAGFKEAISGAAARETISTDLEVMLGSASAAKTMLADLTSFASATPLEMPGITEAARTLLNFNVGAKDVLPLLRQLGDVSGGSADRFASMALVFGQVSSAGRLTGQDLMQMINAGFNPLLEISKRTGESMGSLRKKMEDGGIGIDQVRGALTTATSAGGQFYGMMEKKSQTFDGKMSTLKDSINAAFTAFGAPILTELKPVLSECIALADRLGTAAAGAGAALVNGVSFVREAFSNGSLGEMVGLSLQIGFGKAVNALVGGMRGAVNVLIESSARLPGDLLAGFKVITTPALWGGLADVMNSIASGFTALLASGLAPIIDKLIGVLNQIPGVKIDFKADTLAGALKNRSADLMTGGLAKMGGALQPAVARMKDDMGGMADAFQRGFNGPALIDTSTLESGLATSISNAWGTGTKAAAAAAVGQSPLASGKAAAAGFVDSRNANPLTDRLAKIGGFIGGAGGPRGEKAAQDTAKNTNAIIAVLKDTHRLIERRPVTTSGAF